MPEKWSLKWSGVQRNMSLGFNRAANCVQTGNRIRQRASGIGHRRRVEWMKNEFNCPMLGVNIFEMGSRICCRQRTSDSATDNMKNNNNNDINRSNNKFAELSNILATFLWQATAVKLWPLQGVERGGVCRGVPVWPTSGSKSCIRMSKTLARESKHNTHNISVHFGVVGGHQSKFRSLCSPLPSSLPPSPPPPQLAVSRQISFLSTLALWLSDSATGSNGNGNRKEQHNEKCLVIYCLNVWQHVDSQMPK